MKPFNVWLENKISEAPEDIPDFFKTSPLDSFPKLPKVGAEKAKKRFSSYPGPNSYGAAVGDVDSTVRKCLNIIQTHNSGYEGHAANQVPFEEELKEAEGFFRELLNKVGREEKRVMDAISQSGRPSDYGHPGV